MRNPHKIPRVAFCTGCGRIFDKMFKLRNHRHTFRCGGLWLILERELGVRYRLPTPLEYTVHVQDNHPPKVKKYQQYSLITEMDGESVKEYWGWDRYAPPVKAPKTGDAGWTHINPSHKKVKPTKNVRPVTKQKNLKGMSPKRFAAYYNLREALENSA